MQNLKLKDPILARISRISGQIGGIKKMYEEGRACVEIIQQVQAARAALGKLTHVLLSDEVKRCVDNQNIRELNQVLNKTFKTF